MSHVYLITYMMDGFHEHKRVYADNISRAKQIFKSVMGNRYKIVEVEQVM